MAFVLCIILFVAAWSLTESGLRDLSCGNRFSGSVALLVAFVVALTVGMIINVNFLPVAQ